MITESGINIIANNISNLIEKGRYTVDGVVNDVQIYKKEINGDLLKIHLMFDETTAGTLTNFELLDANGVVISKQPDNITKVTDKLLLVTFGFKITEVI